MIRLFTALELPGEVRSALASWGARVAGEEPAVRLVPVLSLHVTLVFLGQQEHDDVPAIAEAVAGAALPVAPLSVLRPAWLPARRPGVLVADLEEEGRGDRLAALQANLVAALEPWHEPETRGFRPHVTVARVRRGQRIQPGRELPAPPVLRFAPGALVLYRSHQGSGGSTYEPLLSVALREA